MTGSVTFPGIGSGIDGASIARAAADEYSLSNEIYQENITRLSDENTSLERLRTLLLSLENAVSGFSSLGGGAQIRESVSSAEEVVSAVSGSSASFGDYDVSVLSLAAPGLGSFARSFSSLNEVILSDISSSGNVNFAVGTGENAFSFSVPVGPSTTVQDFVDYFNENAQKVASARILNLGTAETPDYRISFTASSFGMEKGSIAASAGNEALFTEDGLGEVFVEEATQAKFSIKGVAGVFSRDANTVSDAIAGLTLTLRGEGSARVSVSPGEGAAAGYLEKFVRAFNELAAFVNAEDRVQVSETTKGYSNNAGSLARTSVDDNALSAVRAAISSARSSDARVSLASLGVTTNRDGSLAFDAETFSAAFAQNSEQAGETLSSLADKLSGSQGIVSQFAGYGYAIDKEIAGNKQEISNLNETISRVERTAGRKEEVVAQSFASLEGLLAKLNADAMFISSLLTF
jgi:flagellar hook-associated protein 2